MAGRTTMMGYGRMLALQALSSAERARPRVLLAGEHPIVLEGLRRIAEHAGFQVVGTLGAGALRAGTLREGSLREGSALLQAADELWPDLIVLDVSIPGLDATEAVRRIRRRNPNVSILFLLQYDQNSMSAAAGHEDSWVVSRNSAVSELGAAMRDILERKKSPSPVTLHTSSALTDGHDGAHERARLTPRQLEVLRMVADGKTAKEIASVLNISARTVEFHKTRITDVLNLRTTAELTKYAVKHRIAGA